MKQDTHTHMYTYTQTHPTHTNTQAYELRTHTHTHAQMSDRSLATPYTRLTTACFVQHRDIRHV